MTTPRKTGFARLLIADYDCTANVLCISIGRSRPTIGQNRGDGFVIRYALNDPKNAYGVTFFQFKTRGWANDLPRFSALIASLLAVDQEQVSSKIERLLRQAASDGNATERLRNKSNLLQESLATAAPVSS